MATDKNRVNAYIADEEYHAFTTFCDLWRCSQSKGVELLIRQYLIEGQSNAPSNVPYVSSDNNGVDISSLIERLEKLEGKIQGVTDIDGKIESAICVAASEAIANSLEPIMDKLALLSNRLRDIENEIGEKYPVPVAVDSEPIDEDELRGITAVSLSPIFDEPENEPLTDSTPQHEVLATEGEGLKGNLEGQSFKTID